MIDAEPTKEMMPIPFGTERHSRYQAGTKLVGFPAELPQPNQTVSSYVQGVSVANVLQMLHLERMTCLLEITADGQFGTLTLVNGELVDADANGSDGEEAVYAILAWRQPHTTILDGVTLFRNTVKSSLSALIVESVRRQDERERDPRVSLLSTALPNADNKCAAKRASNGDAERGRLVETLVMSGASAAAVVRASDERVLAQACERRVGVQTAAHEMTGELAQVVRAALHWARHTDATFEEVTLRFGERHALIVPLDRTGSVFVCATFVQAETIEFARSAVRGLTR